MRHWIVLSWTCLVLVYASAPASATFHKMQIEQVIAGVGDDTTAQAIQLRMRVANETEVSKARLRVYDAAGANPVDVIDFATDVSIGAQGSRILVASPGFVQHTRPGTVPDFYMAELIPESYVAAGSLRFEQDGGFVYWCLSWGGAAYSGPNQGSDINDLDGDYGPPFPATLPSMGSNALRFLPGAGFLSTNNAADYALTPPNAVFENNAGQAFVVTLTGACCMGGVCSEGMFGEDCSNGGGIYNGDETLCGGDSDGDGFDEVCGDDCPADPHKTAPGQCGCGEMESDSDGDSTPDCVDQCAGVPDDIFAPGCTAAIPTVSSWGVLILLLCLLSAETVRSRSTQSPA